MWAKVKHFLILFRRFINARRRIVQPMIDASNRAGKSPVVTVFKSRRRGGKNGSQGIPSPPRFGPSGPGHPTPPGYFPDQHHAQMHPNYHMQDPTSGQSPHFSPRAYIPGGETSPGAMPAHMGGSPVPHTMHAQMQAHAYRAQVPAGQGHSQAMYIPGHQMIMSPAGHPHAQYPTAHGQLLTGTHQSVSPSILPADTMTQQVVDIHSS